MFKSLLVLCSVFVSSLGFAGQGYELGSIDCVASNGVELKTFAHTDAGMLVQTKWGTFEKYFVADLAKVSVEKETVISLVNEEGKSEYLLSLKLNPAKAKAQKSSGHLILVSSLGSDYNSFLATVSCNIKMQAN